MRMMCKAVSSKYICQIIFVTLVSVHPLVQIWYVCKCKQQREESNSEETNAEEKNAE